MEIDELSEEKLQLGKGSITASHTKGWWEICHKMSE